MRPMALQGQGATEGTCADQDVLIAWTLASLAPGEEGLGGNLGHKKVGLDNNLQ